MRVFLELNEKEYTIYLNFDKIKGSLKRQGHRTKCQNKKWSLVVVAYAFNSTTLEAEAGGSL